ncbi:MAG: FUSC family protein [Clostridiaceae bacterium]|jgi:uncharacterized membrane protein YgaE (UPF0421/DUF939 family)|nr:FUSC family protein [Clostridiaceae bacterium]
MEKQEKPEKKKKRFKIGLRTVKTVVAVFICCLIDFLRGTDPIQSSIAAVLCIQPDTKNSIRTGITRIIGTLIGGVTGALVLLFLLEVGISHNSILFYLILCVLLIPVIYIPVRLGWPEATALTCIVYIVIVLGYTSEQTPLEMAIERIIDTLIGIAVAVPINAAFPNRNKAKTDSISENEPSI